MEPQEIVEMDLRPQFGRTLLVARIVAKLALIGFVLANIVFGLVPMALSLSTGNGFNPRFYLFFVTTPLSLWLLYWHTLNSSLDLPDKLSIRGDAFQVRRRSGKSETSRVSSERFFLTMRAVRYTKARPDGSHIRLVVSTRTSGSIVVPPDVANRIHTWAQNQGAQISRTDFDSRGLIEWRLDFRAPNFTHLGS